VEKKQNKTALGISYPFLMGEGGKLKSSRNCALAVDVFIWHFENGSQYWNS
jgi:hypothetical protein